MFSDLDILNESFEKYDKVIVLYMTKKISAKLFTLLKNECKFNLENNRIVFYDKYKNIIKLYNMYEFSDKIMMITDNNQYGNIFNYVDAGIITQEEAINILLRK